MSDLTIDKIKNMLGAHNDGVYHLQSRTNLAEIVEWLIADCERFREICARAEADYRGMAVTLAPYGFYATMKDAIETADYIAAALDDGAKP